jgi:hypothetical protein
MNKKERAEHFKYIRSEDIRSSNEEQEYLLYLKETRKKK